MRQGLLLFHGPSAVRFEVHWQRTFAALLGKRTSMWRWFLFPVVLVAVTARAQAPPIDGPIYPEKLREDVAFLMSVLHRTHPDPYRYITQAELDRMIDSISDGLRVPMDRADLLLHLLPAVHALGDSHVRLDLPRSQRGKLAQDAPVLPLRVKLLSSGLYVEEELKGFRSLPLGARITAINDRPIEEIIATIARHIPVDGANTTLRERFIEREFPWLYRRYVGTEGEFKVRYRDGSGVERMERIFPMTGAEMDIMRKPSRPVLAPWRVQWDPESEAQWVTMRTLDLDSLQVAGVQPERFLTALLKASRRNKARTMVIDVRGADGRDLAAAELVFAAIAKEPFRVVQGMSARTPDVDVPPFEGMPVEHLEALRTQFVPGPNRTSHLRPDDPRLQPLPPLRKAFQGKVYLVCDGATRDAAAALVMMAKRSGRARVVGEEVGTNAFSFTGGRELVEHLPNSGLELRLSLMRYIPDGMPSGPLSNGERPHHEVEQQPWGIAKGRDTLRESLLELIRELR